MENKLVAIKVIRMSSLDSDRDQAHFLSLFLSPKS